MGTVVAIPNMEVSLPVEFILQGGELAIASLVVTLAVALLISDSRYWNKWAPSTLSICSNPLLIIFVAIVIFKITQILH